MADSVTSHILAAINNGQIMGVANGMTYVAIPKADGGYDFYRYKGADLATGTGEDIRAISESDAYRELGVPAGEQGVLGATTEAPSYGGGGTSYSADQIAALNAKHKQNINAINQAYQNGLLTYNEQVAALEDARNNLISQKGQGLESNSAYFSNVSPDAFQSQMGNYNQKVLDAYTQGENTLKNNQASIDYAKNVNEQNYLADLAGENTFNESTGQYSGAYNYTPKTIAAPKINAVTANPLAEAAKLGVPSWAPNYGGMSVSQAKKKEDEAINRYLG